MTNTIAIIPARGGSKGIPGKNLVPICGHPLLAWSIMQALATDSIDSVWVSSDDNKILDVADHYGAHPVKRPMEISGDTATSESAWIHAIEIISTLDAAPEFVVGMQATSPIRDSTDLDNAVRLFRHGEYDSLMSVNEIEDFHTWRIGTDGAPESVNYDYRNRQRRQSIEKKYLENGSFYIFTPDSLKNNVNRLSGNIGIYIMEKFKMFQIDDPQDIPLCEAIMKHYQLESQFITR